MTAAIFLSVFLAGLLVAAVQWVFIFTVYRPVQRWLANRAWEKASAGCMCIVAGCSGKPPVGSMFCRAHGDCEISHPLSTHASPRPPLCKRPCIECWHRHDHDADGFCSSEGNGVPCPCRIPHGKAGDSTAASSSV